MQHVWWVVEEAGMVRLIVCAAGVGIGSRQCIDSIFLVGVWLVPFREMGIVIVFVVDQQCIRMGF